MRHLTRHWWRALLALVLGLWLSACNTPRERYQAPAPGVPTTLPSPKTSAPLPAQPTLAELRAYALTHNPRILAAWQEWRAALQGPTLAAELMDPMVGTGARIKQTEMADMQEQFVMASQELPWPGKRSLRRQVATAAAEMAWHRLADTRRQVLLELTQVHAESIYLARALAVEAEALQVMSEVEALVRARYALGKAMASEVSKLQLELARMEGDLAAMRLMQPPLLARLNALLNRPATTPWTPPATFPERAPATRELATWQRWQADQHPALRAMLAELTMGRADLALMGRARYPDFTVAMEYMEGQEKGFTRPTTDGDDELSLSVSINLPIWRDKYDAMEMQAAHKLAATQAREQTMRRMLESELSMAFAGWLEAERQLVLYRDTLIPKAKQTLSESLAAYQQGQAELMAVLDTERLMLALRLSLERAHADRLLRLAELERLSGWEEDEGGGLRVEGGGLKETGDGGGR